jgi:hypothetical protein
MTFADERHDELSGFEGGEALAAGETLASTTDLTTFGRKT